MKNPTPNLDYNAWASWRVLLATLFLYASVPVGLSLTGCRSPIIEINRTGPLLPEVKLIEFNDSLNGNTVPVSTVP